MSALNRLTAKASRALLFVAGIWFVCLFILLPMHPGATQANKTYHLGTFTAHMFALANSLQHEMLLIAGSNIHPDNNSADKLEQAVARSDFARNKINKFWGRFDSTPYGKSFRNQIEMAFTRLDAVDRKTKRSQASELEIIASAKALSSVIGELLSIDTYVDDLKISVEETNLLRNGLSSSMRLTRLMHMELLAGMSALANQKLDKTALAQWQSIAQERQKTLKEFIANSALTPGLVPAINSALEGIRPAAELGDHFIDSASQGTTSEYPQKSDWFDTYSAGPKSSIAMISVFQSHMTANAVNGAKDASDTLVLVVALSTILTCIILIWQNYRDPELVFLVFMAALNIPLLAWGLTAGGDFLANENGALETAQAITLAVAFAFFCADAARHDHNSRVAALVLVSVCFFMFFREVDFRTFGAPEWLINLSSGSGRRTIFYIGTAAVIIYALRNIRSLIALIPSGLSIKAWPFYLWPVLLLLGEGVEELTHATRKDDLHGFWADGQFWEEMLELDAYLVLAFAAIMFGKIVRTAPSHQGMDTELTASEDKLQQSVEEPVE